MQNKIAFIYPGQGSQAIGMGQDFIKNFSIAKELCNRASECLHIDMLELIQDESRLNETKYTQPAIFLVSAMADSIIRQESDIKPALSFGHSLGEVSAYCLNGGASFEDSIMLTHKRGEFMADACSKDSKDEVGMLVSLGLDVEKVESICKELQNEGLKVWAANYNLTAQIVLAGLKNDLAIAEKRLKEAGAKRAMLLKMSVASHCPLLDSALPPFKALLESSLKDCGIDIISNATLDIYSKKAEALDYLTMQLIKPVLYYKSVLKAKDLGITKFIELGHGSILAGLNGKIADIPTMSINNTESIKML